MKNLSLIAGTHLSERDKWNELHIDETPPRVISSLSVRYPTILNVIKHGKRWADQLGLAHVADKN